MHACMHAYVCVCTIDTCRRPAANEKTDMHVFKSAIPLTPMMGTLSMARGPVDPSIQRGRTPLLPSQIPRPFPSSSDSPCLGDSPPLPTQAAPQRVTPQ